MGDNVKHTNHHAEWIKAEKESAPLSGMGVSVSWIGTGGCFREFCCFEAQRAARGWSY